MGVVAMDYYSIMNVKRNANDDEVKKAYRRLPLVCHPDKNPASKQQDAEEKFKQIYEAYNVLNDPRKCIIYDVEALKSVQFPPPCLSTSSSSAPAASFQNHNSRHPDYIRIKIVVKI